MTTAAPDLQRLKHGPILPTLLRLAVPNVMAMAMTVAVGVAETAYVGRLGTVPLAALALVFPFVMLIGMLSAGAMGGGVSSAISRALGAGQAERARALAVHAVAIGAGAGVVHALLMLALGPVFYGWLGGRGPVLDEALRYATIAFTGAPLMWLANTLASVLRGGGQMRVASVAIIVTAVAQIALGALFAFGAGPLPAYGIAGVAGGQVAASALGVGLLWRGAASPAARLPLRFGGVRWQGALCRDILKVGGVACISPLQSVLAVLICTGLVAHLGVAPLAGYSIGQRLEFMLIPIAFGIGVASVPMVGLAIGAGDVARARRVAWTAGGLSALNLALLGGGVALVPDAWATLFTRDEGVLAHARDYLRVVGPAFPFFGLGLTLYFASQGSGRVLGPVLAGTVRLALVAGAGWWLVAHEAPPAGYFAMVAAGMVVYGLSTAAAVKLTRWGR